MRTKEQLTEDIRAGKRAVLVETVRRFLGGMLEAITERHQELRAGATDAGA